MRKEEKKNLKKKEALRKQKKEERLPEESCIRKAADATRRVESALANFPKIGDKQPLDTAIESLESNFKHADLPLEHWNYALFVALIGKYQELVADIPYDRTVSYSTFKRQLFETAGYTRNAAGLEMWDNSHSKYAQLTPAQLAHRQKD